MLECLFITIIHQQDLKKKGVDYIHWLNTARYTNVANTRKKMGILPDKELHWKWKADLQSANVNHFYTKVSVTFL